MLKPFHSFALVTFGIAAACASIPVIGDPAVPVAAQVETAPVGTANEDAADDPAIWRNADDPAKSLIVGTDKKGGLYVYDLTGKELSFLPAPGLNNVDLVELPGGEIFVAASDRSDLAQTHIFLARLDASQGRLIPLGRVPVGEGEGYGICFGAAGSDGRITVFSAPKNGVIYRTSMATRSANRAAQTDVLTSVPSQPEGCVFDERSGTLYIGEENTGIWAIDTANGEKAMVAPVGTGLLVADVEGLAIAADGAEGGYLVASSQGDNAFAVYTLPDMIPVGRFRIEKNRVGSVEETDGIELDPRGFGNAFPNGLFVAQDGVNEAGAQNFKLVRWDDILERLQAE